MKVTLVTGSTIKILTVGQIQRHLRLSTASTAENALLEGLREAAVQSAENFTGRKFTTQTWKIYFDEFPSSNHLELPFAPLKSIPSSGLVYTNSEGGSTTMSSTRWSQDIASEPGRLVLKYNDDWPSETLANNNPISIEFRCGYRSTAEPKLPQSIKQAVLLIIGSWYENREEVIVSGQSFQRMPLASKALLSPYKLFRF